MNGFALGTNKTRKVISFRNFKIDILAPAITAKIHAKTSNGYLEQHQNPDRYNNR